MSFTLYVSLGVHKIGREYLIEAEPGPYDSPYQNHHEEAKRRLKEETGIKSEPRIFGCFGDSRLQPKRESANKETMLGLGVRSTPCGIWTTSRHRKRHNWVVALRERSLPYGSNRKEYGEDHTQASQLATECSKAGIEVWLLLEEE